MTCNDVRHRLARSGAAGAIRQHFAGCPGCAAYARRFDAAQQLFGRQHAGIDPDAGFAARVIDALPQRGGVLEGAALKLLPAALALVLVLAGWVLIDSRRPSTVADQTPSDDVLGWVLQDTENGS